MAIIFASLGRNSGDVRNELSHCERTGARVRVRVRKRKKKRRRMAAVTAAKRKEREEDEMNERMNEVQYER